MATVTTSPLRTVLEYPRGEVPTTTTPGDFFICCDWAENILGRLIRAGERIWYGNTDFARWTHSGMIVDRQGGTVEAQAQGVVRGNVSTYKNADFAIVRPLGVTWDQRYLAVQCAESMLGEAYGYVDFICGMVPRCIFHWNLSFHSGNAPICSEEVARCTEKYIARYPWALEEMMPASLAAYWHVRTDQPLPKLGWFDRVLNVIGSVFPK